MYIQHYLSPLGPITMASNGNELTGLWFDGQKYFPTFLNKAEEKDLPVFEQTRQWLDAYFQGEKPSFTPPLKVEGSSFKQLIADIMLHIPYGQTSTYGKIAAEAALRLGKTSMSAQAVGGAVGHNDISLIIPCHRVLGSNGSLTGYAGGLERKAALLTLEKVLK